MPHSLKRIDNGAFEGCQNLQQVSLNEELEQLGEPEKKGLDIDLGSPEIEENVGVFQNSKI